MTKGQFRNFASELRKITKPQRDLLIEFLSNRKTGNKEADDRHFACEIETAGFLNADRLWRIYNSAYKFTPEEIQKCAEAKI